MSWWGYSLFFISWWSWIASLFQCIHLRLALMHYCDPIISFPLYCLKHNACPLTHCNIFNTLPSIYYLNTLIAWFSNIAFVFLLSLCYQNYWCTNISFLLKCFITSPKILSTMFWSGLFACFPCGASPPLIPEPKHWAVYNSKCTIVHGFFVQLVLMAFNASF